MVADPDLHGNAFSLKFEQLDVVQILVFIFFICGFESAIHENFRFATQLF
jgi:hypothetical protein